MDCSRFDQSTSSHDFNLLTTPKSAPQEITVETSSETQALMQELIQITVPSPVTDTPMQELIQIAVPSSVTDALMQELIQTTALNSIADILVQELTQIAAPSSVPKIALRDVNLAIQPIQENSNLSRAATDPLVKDEKIIEEENQEKKNSIIAHVESTLREVEAALLLLERGKDLNERIEQLQETDGNPFTTAINVGSAASMMFLSYARAFANRALQSLHPQQIQKERAAALKEEKDNLTERYSHINLTELITNLEEAKKQAEMAGLAFKDIKPADCRYNGEEALAALIEYGKESSE